MQALRDWSLLRCPRRVRVSVKTNLCAAACSTAARLHLLGVDHLPASWALRIRPQPAIHLPSLRTAALQHAGQCVVERRKVAVVVAHGASHRGRQLRRHKRTHRLVADGGVLLFILGVYL